MAVNRLTGVFTRQIVRLKESPVHVHSAHLAPVARHRSDVVVGLPDVAKRSTHYYPFGASWVHNWLLRSLPWAAAVVTSTEWGRHDIARVTGFPVERIVAVPPFSQLPAPTGTELGPPDPPTERSPWRLLYVAVDRPHKNVGFFLQLLASLDSRFVGTFVGRLTPSHRDAVRRLGLTSRLTMLDSVPDLLPVYRSAQVFAFPSMYEGFGYPLMEAMSQGIPVLASTATCIPEVVGPGGRLLDPEDVAAWSAAILDLTDPRHYQTARDRAREQSRSFTPERTARNLHRAYEIVRSIARPVVSVSRAPSP